VSGELASSLEIGSQQNGTGGAYWSLSCVGGTSSTDTTVEQRFESCCQSPRWCERHLSILLSADQRVGSHAENIDVLQDNFGTRSSDLSAASLTSCVCGAWRTALPLHQ
jgi:hypothetical protein